MASKRIPLGGLINDQQSLAASRHLKELENHQHEHLDTKATLDRLYPSVDNPRRLSLDVAGVSPETIELLRLKPREPIEAWHRRLTEFLADLNSKGRVEAEAVWSDIFSLAESIRTQGILQPIIAKPSGQIIAGECRWTAAQLAGLSNERVIFRHIDEDKEHLLRLIENIQRRDLSVAEITLALRRVMGALTPAPLAPNNNDITVDKVMSVIGCARTQAAYYRALCRLDEGSPILAQILSGGYTSLRTAYEDASAYLRSPTAGQPRNEVPPPTDNEANTPPPTPPAPPAQRNNQNRQASVSRIKMRMPGTDGGNRLLQALKAIQLPATVTEQIELACKAWTAAPENVRKKVLTSTLEAVMAALDEQEQAEEQGGAA